MTIDVSKDCAGDRFDLEVQKRKNSKLSESFPGQVTLSEDVIIRDDGRTEDTPTGHGKCQTTAECVSLVAVSSSFPELPTSQGLKSS